MQSLILNCELLKYKILKVGYSNDLSVFNAYYPIINELPEKTEKLFNS